MINNIEMADLREEPAYSFIVILSVSDGPGPVWETCHQWCVMSRSTFKLMDDLTFMKQHNIGPYQWLPHSIIVPGLNANKDSQH